MEWFARFQPLTMSLGMLCLIVGLLLWQGPLDGAPIEVATGVLVGLSIVLNGAAIVGAAPPRRA